MYKKVVSSLAMLLVGITTTAYAGGYYHGYHYDTANINDAPVDAITYTQAPSSIYDNPGLKSNARGAELYITNDGNHKGFRVWNQNYGSVSSKTETTSQYGDVRYNNISASSFGALTSINSEGRRNYFHTVTENKGYVAAETTTRAHADVKNNEISTRAVGAQTYLISEGNGTRGHVFNINDGEIQALTTTFADDQVHANTINTTAVGASLTIYDTKVGGQSDGRYYRRSHNEFGSLNRNFEDVLAQTNTEGHTVSGNTINTTAVGASTSIITGYSYR